MNEDSEMLFFLHRQGFSCMLISWSQKLAQKHADRLRRGSQSN